MAARLAADRAEVGQATKPEVVSPAAVAAPDAALAGSTDATLAPATLLESDGELSAQRDAPVGGQAVLEGVMMRGVSHWAVAVRKPTAEQLREADGEDHGPIAAMGEVEVTTFPLDSAMKRHRVLRLL